MDKPRSGDRITAQTARPRVVMGLVIMHGLVLALLTGVPACVAALEREWALALSLWSAAAIPLTAFFIQRRQSPITAPYRIEGLVAVAGAFLAASVLVTPAFMVLGMAPIAAFFEAVSGVTTTGLSVAEDAQSWPLSGHFLRAWLQWSGGFAFAAVAIAIVVGRGVVALRLGLTESPGDTLLGSTRARARAVLSAYIAISAAVVVTAMLVADRPVDGVLIALSAVSTGGFAPAPDSLGSAGLGLQIVASAGMLAGAVSMTLYATAWREGLRAFLADPELRTLYGFMAAAALVLVAIEGLRAGGIGPWQSLFTVMSAQSTSGFTTVPIDRLSTPSVTLLILCMAIGGSLGSTAGGLKAFRAAFAASAARAALTRTALSPNAVTRLRVFGKAVEGNEGVIMFGLFFLFIFSVFTLWIGLLLTGLEPLPALFDTVSAFSTVGLSAGAIGPELNDGLKLGVAAAMLLGRVEFLAFLALLRPRTWLS